MKYLLDTNVISEFASNVPSPLVITWLDAQNPFDLYLSVITIGELGKGVAKLPASRRRNRLEMWLHDDLMLRFNGRVLSINTDVMLVWGQLNAKLEFEGRPLAVMDTLLAAQALYYQCSLVTRNESHFTPTGVNIVNPWTGAA